MIYLETWGSTPPCVAVVALEFHCLFSAEYTRHRILVHCISHCLLCLVSCLSSWLVDGASLPCLAVKTLSGEGSLFMWGGCGLRNPLGPNVNLWTTCTVGRQFVLRVHCAKFLSVTSSVLLSLWLEMSLSSEERASESDCNISSCYFRSLRFLLVADTLWRNSAPTNPAPSDCDSDLSVCTSWPVACYYSDGRRTELLSWRQT